VGGHEVILDPCRLEALVCVVEAVLEEVRAAA
jgi:hypothetical protein